MNSLRIAFKKRVSRNAPFAVMLSIYGVFATNTRAAEHFPIDFGLSSTGDVTLHFDAEPNQTYQVQASPDLDSWVDHGTLIEDAAGPMVIRISPGHQKRGFFRVVAETQLPGTDLALRIGSRLDLPAMRLAGDGTTFDVPLEVENVGDDPTPALGSISIAVLAKNVEDDEEVQIVVETPSLRALEAGASTSIKLSDLSFPAGLSGEHSLVVVLLPNPKFEESDAANNRAESEATTLLARDFLDLTKIDTDGASFEYNSTGTAGSSEITVDMSALGQDRFRFNELNDLPDPEDQILTWRRGNGNRIERRMVDTDLGSMTFDFTHLDAAPATLIRGKTYQDTSPVDVSVRVVGTTISLSGTAEVTTKLVGYEMVTVPAGKFLAAKILVDLEVETSGTWRGLATTLSFDDELVYYAAAGVGIIKSSDEISFSFFLETAGSESARVKETRQLRAYSLP